MWRPVHGLKAVATIVQALPGLRRRWIEAKRAANGGPLGSRGSALATPRRSPIPVVARPGGTAGWPQKLENHKGPGAGGATWRGAYEDFVFLWPSRMTERRPAGIARLRTRDPAAFTNPRRRTPGWNGRMATKTQKSQRAGGRGRYPAECFCGICVFVAIKNNGAVPAGIARLRTRDAAARLITRTGMPGPAPQPPRQGRHNRSPAFQRGVGASPSIRPGHGSNNDPSNAIPCWTPRRGPVPYGDRSTA
jgi:hypothetical protein